MAAMQADASGSLPAPAAFSGDDSAQHAGQSLLRGGGALLLGIFLLSGASGLVYQVVWSRSLTLVFGSTTQGIATVLAAFMGGLALGSWLAARVGDRVASPLRIYGLLEGGIALLSLAVLLLLPALEGLYQILYGRVPLSLGGLTALRLVLASLFLLPATTLMGATLPVLSASFERMGRVAGQGASILYAFNTIGAVAGSAAAGFLLLPALGATGTTLAAAAGNLAAALGALWLSRQVEEQGRQMRVPFASGKGAPRDEAPAEEEALPAATRAAVTAAIAASGAAALVLEVCWTRTLSLTLGSSTQAFTIMLTTFLIGLAGGSALTSRWLGRLRDPAGVFAMAEIGAGFAVYAGIFLFPELPYAFLKLYGATREAPELFHLGRFTLAAAIMLAPTLLLGATFPLALRCVRLGARDAARPVGLLYSVNTLGAIAGSLTAGFVLIPAVGLRLTLVIAAMVCLAIGAALLALSSRARHAVRWAFASAIFLIMPGLPLGAPAWNPMLMTSGVFQYAPRFLDQLPTRAAFLEYHDPRSQLYYRDGLTTTVTVEKRPMRSDGKVWLVLTVNGKVDASTVGDMETQILLGQAPLLISKDPSNVLVIGWGSGITVGSTLAHESVRSVRVVEIEEAVVEASGLFRDFNGDPRKDPRIELEINDARHSLLVDPRRYDVIISEPSNPWLSGPSRLFTREFFEMARERLAPGGILCQWVQMYGLDVDSYLALLRTLSDVFADVVVLKGSPGDTIVLASAEPIRFDLDQIQRRLQDPKVAAELARMHMTNLPAFLARYRTGGDVLRATVGKGILNTDDNAYIEFAAARTLYEVEDIAVDSLLLRSVSSPLDRSDLSGLAPESALRIGLQLARQWLEQGLVERARGALDWAQAALPASPAVVAEAAAIRGTILEREGSMESARSAWSEALEQDPNCEEALLGLGKLLAKESETLPRAIELLERAARSLPASPQAHLELARVLRASGNHLEAIQVLDAAAALDAPPSIAAFIEMEMGRACLAAGDLPCAVDRLLRYFREWREVPKPAQLSIDAALDLGQAYMLQGNRTAAMEHFRVAAELGGTLARWHRRQAEEATARGATALAEQHLREAVELNAFDADSYNALAAHLVREGRWDEAEQTWRELLVRHPDDLSAIRGILAGLEQQGRIRESVPYLEHLIDVEMDGAVIALLQQRLAQLKADLPAGPEPSGGLSR